MADNKQQDYQDSKEIAWPYLSDLPRPDPERLRKNLEIYARNIGEWARETRQKFELDPLLRLRKIY